MKVLHPAEPAARSFLHKPGRSDSYLRCGLHVSEGPTREKNPSSSGPYGRRWWLSVWCSCKPPAPSRTTRSCRPATPRTPLRWSTTARLYLYTSHDEDVTVNNFFTMNDWRLYSTADMVNWTDHGSPAGYKSFSWGTGDAWASAGCRKKRQVLSLRADQQLDRREDRRGGREQSLGPVHRPARKGADLHRKRQHRPDGVHRRRRTGLSVLGQSARSST